jgi:geranylgeranyl diphosphate synthase type I
MSTPKAVLEQRLMNYRPLIIEEMRQVVGEHTSELYGWMRYHLGWEDDNARLIEAAPGKLLRPTALLLAAETHGGLLEQAVPAAAAVQLVHDFSLIHDDIEDASERRRGRPTLWVLAGTSQAINTGDGMYTLARSAMQRLHEKNVDDRRILSAIAELDRACLRLVEGQYQDISFESRPDVSHDEYSNMIEGKTGALLAAAFAMGGILAGTTEPAVEALRKFGLRLGLAFQAIDDLLGIWGDPEITGKPVGEDLATRKMTYPVIHSLASNAAPQLAMAYRQSQDAPIDIAALSNEIEAVGGKTATEEIAEEHASSALTILDELPISASERTLLEAFATTVTVRRS